MKKKHESNTRDRIIDEAAQQFYLNGYKETTMRALASAVGIQHPSLFSIFENKSAIAAVLLARYFRGIKEYTKKLQDEIGERHSRTEYQLIFFAINCMINSKDSRFAYFYSSFYEEDSQRIDEVVRDLHILYDTPIDENKDLSVNDMIHTLDYQLFSYIVAMLTKLQSEDKLSAKNAAIYFAAKKIDCQDPMWNLSLDNVIEFYDKHWTEIDNLRIDVYKDILSQKKYDQD